MPKIRFNLSDFLDSYIPAELQENAEMHRRARMFMLSHVFGPILGSTLPIYLYVMDISRDYRTLVFFMSVMMFWTFPIALRITKQYRTLCFISVQNLIVCVLWSCFAYGGINSPFLSWILIFPLLAFLYLPPSGWVRNVLLIQIYGSVATFMFLFFSGYPFPSVDIEQLQIIGLISLAASAIYFAMMALYFAKMYKEQGDFTRELNSLVSTSDNLRDLAQAANQASKAKSDFIAGMSHELRTPLNAIIGYSQLLRDEAEDEGDDETVVDIGRIHDAGTHLLSLIDDILSYSRIEAGKMPVNPTLGSIRHQFATWFANDAGGRAFARASLLPAALDDSAELVIDWTLTKAIISHIVAGLANQDANSRVEIVPHGTSSELLVQIVHRDADGRASPIEVDSEIFEDENDTSSTKYGATGIEFPLAQKLIDLLGGHITQNSFMNGPALLLTIPTKTKIDKLAA